MGWRVLKPNIEAHAVNGRETAVLLAQLPDFDKCHVIPPDHGTNMLPGPQVPDSAENHGKVMVTGNSLQPPLC